MNHRNENESNNHNDIDADKLKYYSFEEFKKLTEEYGSVFFKASNSDTIIDTGFERDISNIEEKNCNNNSNLKELEEHFDCFVGNYRLISLLHQGFFGKVHNIYKNI